MTDQQEAHTPPAVDLAPVPVHITGMAAEVAGKLPKPDQRQRVAVPRSLVLTADEPAQPLLRPDPDLVCAYVFCFTNQVVISRSKGDAQATQNTAATITRPNGTLIPASVLVPLETTSELWVSTGTYPTIVSIFPVYKR